MTSEISSRPDVSLATTACTLAGVAAMLMSLATRRVAPVASRNVTSARCIVSSGPPVTGST